MNPKTKTDGRVSKIAVAMGDPAGIGPETSYRLAEVVNRFPSGPRS